MHSCRKETLGEKWFRHGSNIEKQSLTHRRKEETDLESWAKSMILSKQLHTLKVPSAGWKWFQQKRKDNQKMGKGVDTKEFPWKWYTLLHCQPCYLQQQWNPIRGTAFNINIHLFHPNHQSQAAWNKNVKLIVGSWEGTVSNHNAI